MQIMNIQPWTVLETKYLHPGIRLDRCELPHGHILDCELLDYADEIMVFALTKDRQVVLIKQYRHGVQDVIVEFPGGSVDEGETPLEAAKRELMEETGYAGDQFIALGQVSPNPAIHMNKLHLFLALDIQQSGEQSGYDTGAVEVVLMPLEEVTTKAGSGEFINALNITTLFFALEYLRQSS